MESCSGVSNFRNGQSQRLPRQLIFLGSLRNTRLHILRRFASTSLTISKPPEIQFEQSQILNMKFSPFVSSAIVTLPFLIQVQGHGYMYEPPTRNFVANNIGLNSGSQAAVPPKEYCPHCLNQNAGVCGITQDGTTDYDLWLDSMGEPMPFVSQRTYQPGQIIEVRATLTANHAGHAELRGCPVNDGEEVNQACLDGYTFEFIADDAYNMPKGTS